MKRIVCLIIVLTTIFLVSCAGEVTEVTGTKLTAATVVTSGIASTEVPMATTSTAGTTVTSEATTAAQTYATTSQTSPAEVFVPNGYANTYISDIIETKSKVMIFEGLNTFRTFDVVYYYSKADGEFYPFCFDPFCTHEEAWRGRRNVIGCLANGMANTFVRPLDADPVFINSRFYFVFHDTIYSCSEFATDIREEYSFHEYDNYTTQDINRRQNADAYPICDFFNDGASIFFKHVDEKGAVIQYRYDTSSNKLYDMSTAIEKAEEKVGAPLYARKYVNGKVYLDGYTNIVKQQGDEPYKTVNGDFVGYFEADYEFKDIKQVDFKFPVSPWFVTDNGFIYAEYDENNVRNLMFIDFNGETKMLISDMEKTLGKSPEIMYYKDDCFYYYAAAPVVLGKDESLLGATRKNESGGKIYKYDLKTGKSQCVFDNLNYDYFEIFYIGDVENVVVMKVQKYEKISATDVRSTSGIIIKAALDENGNFIDLEEVELE